MLFASANPEDYTNRGRIITPLKDRFGAQIRTHYPLEVDIEVDIAKQEARRSMADGIRVEVPDYMAEIVATLSHLARQSPHINQRSGVSVRLTVSNLETLVANATRRALLHGETEVVPRVSDLEALASSTAGKVEIESLEEGRDEQIVEHLLPVGRPHRVQGPLPDRETCATCSTPSTTRPSSAPAKTCRSADYVALVESMPALRQPVAELTGGDESAGRWWPAPSSSCSRACTCPSASTRNRSAPAPSTAAADDPTRYAFVRHLASAAG